jgi:hypothetical protein
MSKRIQQSNQTASTNKLTPKQSSNIGYVVDVILDDSHPRLKDPSTAAPTIFSEKDTSGLYGAVVRLYSDTTTPNERLLVYKPYDPTNLEIPLIGEVVEIIESGSNKFYKRIPNYTLNRGSARGKRTTSISIQKEKENASGEYNTVMQTGTPTTSVEQSEVKTKLGEYFEYTPISRLKIYEGDKLIQSRFGQSIRFSGYNNDDNVFSPTIIIRNRQSSELQVKEGDVISEDVNSDGSTIVLSSGEHQIPFTATTSITPNKFSSYPNPLKGDDHLLINSGKIILSAKTGQMVFHSKGDYGFISDGKFAIDGGLGAELDFGDDVKITTDRNSSNVSINTGSGRIFLNTNTSGKSPNTDKGNEPLVRGNTLKELLETMIDLIVEQVYKTPSGPTAIGPENRAEFNSLKRRLKEMLSTQNFTE